MPKNGFSLVELLITISIIAVLSALGLIAYTAVLQQGRDSKRQSDLRSIQSALEQYMSDQSYYPDSITPGSSLVYGTKIYMNTIPADPIGTPQYSYVPLPSSCDNLNTKCTDYCLYAKLGNSTLPAGCTDTTYNFAVTPP